MKKVFVLLLINYLFFGSLFSQPAKPPMTKEEETQASQKEAGAYARKSVSYINALWLMDRSVRAMQPKEVNFVLEEIKKKIMLKRFDYNPLPDALIMDFVVKANQLDSVNIDQLAKLMDEIIVPKILKILDAEKEMRTSNLLTEQQKNSFYAQKAKEFGITGAQVMQIMNSAYIFIPMASRLKEKNEKKNLTIQMDIGILWYHLSTKGEKPQAHLMVKKMTRSSGFGSSERRYLEKGKMIDGKTFANHSMIENAVRNLVVATQEIPEFRLSAQVVDQEGGSVGFNLGTQEGIYVDDKYKIVEFFEEADGTIKQNDNGWVMVKMVADSNSKEGYKSKARVVAGDPQLGAVLSEYPRVPIDILFKLKTFPYKQSTDNFDGTFIDSLDLSGGMGLEVDAMYNLGRYFGLSQFYVDFGFGYGFGSASGTAVDIYEFVTDSNIVESQIKAVKNLSFDFSLLKKFYFGRLSLTIQPVFGVQMVSVDAGFYTNILAEDVFLKYTNTGSGFAVNGALEYAVLPQLNFGIGGGYQLFGEVKDWLFQYKIGKDGSWEPVDFDPTSSFVAINHTGLTIQAYLTYSPPSLPFDPWRMLRAYFF